MQPVRSRPLSAVAYDTIRGRILSSEYPFGFPLSRRRLAAELGTSLDPVAEALQQLEQEGFVESLPRVGTRVCIPSADDVREKYIVREALESQSARLFAAQATARERKEMMRRAMRIDKMAVSLGDTGDDARRRQSTYEAEHMKLHIDLARTSRCGALVEALERSGVLIFNARLQGLPLMEAAMHPPLPPAWHQTLIAGLSTGDVEQADRTMREHVNFRREEFLKWIARTWDTQPDKAKFERGPQWRRKAGTGGE